MTNVTKLHNHRGGNEDQPHTRGLARCVACKHEWEAIVPAGTIQFECPSCGLERGSYVYPAGLPDGQTRLECGNCGSQHFQIGYDDKGFYFGLCVGCGLTRVL